MTVALILLISLSVTFPAQAVDIHKPSFVSVKSGERVTLNCTILDNSQSDYIVWYKQRFGDIPQEVGGRFLDGRTSTQFDSSGVKVENINNGMSMTIQHAQKDDAGFYFCGQSRWEKVIFFSGTFLVVTGQPDLSVSVSQTSMLDSVPPGSSVSLQCSVLSEIRTAEIQVLWFRATPSQSPPQIIYTHHNNSDQCESDSSTTHTCVYNFSKNIFSVNDTGTYYCAVTMCGKIVFGTGTQVQLDVNTFNGKIFKGTDFILICLGVVLAGCVVVICALVIFHYIKLHRAKHPHGTLKKEIPNQDRDAVDLKYAALHFNGRQTKITRAKIRQPQVTVYSEVMCTPVT